MEQEDVVTVNYKGDIAIITLNRPAKLNALNSDHYYLLGERLREVDKRDDIFITVVTGKGRYFSAGADVAGASDPIRSANKRRDFTRSFVINNLDLSRAFYTHSKILIVALNGPVVGLTAGVIASADFIYAAPHTFLFTPFASVGLVTEGASSHSFVKRLGISKANEALLMGKRISCEELVATGFVNKVFTPPSGRQDDSDGFLALVLAYIEEQFGPHLNRSSLLKMKELIRRPERDVLERQNVAEVFEGLERFLTGTPQEEFRKIATGQKKHKL
ncbi:hypothetical protein VTN49DRAFT_2467 [Thermomyces lanuginosus]|uniref:uncharacterized protein n=1 Tax=Thermomyces lanuginosus TaxID=5541 RepID=UPI0037420B36